MTRVKRARLAISRPINTQVFLGKETAGSVWTTRPERIRKDPALVTLPKDS